MQEVQLPDSDRVICENQGTGIPTLLEQLRHSGTASVKFSNAISHFTAVFTQVERGVGALPNPAGSLAGRMPAGRPAEILALFAQQPELSAADVAQATGLGRAMVPLSPAAPSNCPSQSSDSC